jgi:hypothetical protein
MDLVQTSQRFEVGLNSMPLHSAIAMQRALQSLKDMTPI